MWGIFHRFTGSEVKHGFLRLFPFDSLNITMTLTWPHVLYVGVREDYSTCVCFSTFTSPLPSLSLCWFRIVVSALQIKSQELFDEWVSKLRHHRLYRQNEIAMYPNEKSFYYPHYPSPNSPSLAESASIRKVSPCTVPENSFYSGNPINAFGCVSAHEYHYYICNMSWSQSPHTEYSYEGSTLLLDWPLDMFAIPVHVYTKAVHCAFCSSLLFKLQQPGQGSSLAPVIWRHGQVLQRWDNRAVPRFLTLSSTWCTSHFLCWLHTILCDFPPVPWLLSKMIKC